MVSTLNMPPLQLEGLINRPIISQLEYLCAEEDSEVTAITSALISSTLQEGASCHNMGNMLHNIKKVLCTDNFIIENEMVEVNLSKEEKFEELVNLLLSVEETVKLMLYEKDDRSIGIWVISSKTDAKTVKKYCYLFADKIEEDFEFDYEFYFRVLEPSSNEVKFIPPEAQVFYKS